MTPIELNCDINTYEKLIETIAEQKFLRHDIIVTENTLSVDAIDKTPELLQNWTVSIDFDADAETLIFTDNDDSGETEKVWEAFKWFIDELYNTVTEEDFNQLESYFDAVFSDIDDDDDDDFF